MLFGVSAPSSSSKGVSRRVSGHSPISLMLRGCSLGIPGSSRLRTRPGPQILLFIIATVMGGGGEAEINLAPVPADATPTNMNMVRLQESGLVSGSGWQAASHGYLNLYFIYACFASIDEAHGYLHIIIIINRRSGITSHTSHGHKTGTRSMQPVRSVPLGGPVVS